MARVARARRRKNHSYGGRLPGRHTHKVRNVDWLSFKKDTRKSLLRVVRGSMHHRIKSRFRAERHFGGRARGHRTDQYQAKGDLLLS